MTDGRKEGTNQSLLVGRGAHFLYVSFLPSKKKGKSKFQEVLGKGTDQATFHRVLDSADSDVTLTQHLRVKLECTDVDYLNAF